jgi:hypothetical protein
LQASFQGALRPRVDNQVGGAKASVPHVERNVNQSNEFVKQIRGADTVTAGDEAQMVRERHGLCRTNGQGQQHLFVTVLS